MTILDKLQAKVDELREREARLRNDLQVLISKWRIDVELCYQSCDDHRGYDITGCADELQAIIDKERQNDGNI